MFIWLVILIAIAICAYYIQPIVVGGGLPKYLYHGSRFKIDKFLEPRPSKIIDGESAVFATQDKWLALAFIPGLKNDIGIGYVGRNGVTRGFIDEDVPGSFDKMKIPGFLYKVSSRGFHTDDRLGMKKYEFVNPEPVRILETEEIKNVWDEINKYDIDLTNHVAVISQRPTRE